MTTIPAGYNITNALVSLEDVKLALRIDDSNDDYQLARCIDAASRSIEWYCQRRFYQDSQPSARIYKCTNPWVLHVEDFMTMDGFVMAIDYAGDGTYSTIAQNPTDVAGDGVLAQGDFQLEPPNGLVNGQPFAWDTLTMVRSLYYPVYGGIAYPKPYLQLLIKITAQWGWNYIPVDVQQAAIYETVKLFKSQDTPFGATAFGETGIVRMQPQLHSVSKLLLENYRKYGVDVI